MKTPREEAHWHLNTAGHLWCTPTMHFPGCVLLTTAIRYARADGLIIGQLLGLRGASDADREAATDILGITLATVDERAKP